MHNWGLGSWPLRRARMSPDRVAVIQGERSYTYQEMLERSLRVAHALAAHGVRAGSRVAYLGPNHPAFLEVMFGAGLLGAIFVPLNTRLAAPELDFILADSGASVLVWAPSHEAVVAQLAAPVTLLPHGFAADAPATPLDSPVGPSSTAMILYTSGTTGRPKGVMLTHDNLAWNTVNLLLDVDLTSSEVTLVSAPMFHVAALNQTVLPTFCKGGTLVLVPAFDPAETLTLIARHRVTYLFGVPAMFAAIARSPGWSSADLSSVRSLICGGAPVPAPLIEIYQRRGLTFMQGYGLTEAAPGVLFLRADQSAAKAGSAGTPAFFTDVRRVAVDGSAAPSDAPGEILVQGPNVMAGYWNRPADTAAVLDGDGWLRTGDIAVADPDGCLYVRDRVSDMFISGGENVYPAEVESALFEHPEVAECAVYGVPDERWGEVGCAVVVPRPGCSPDSSGLLAFLDGRIARYKIPKSVVFATELPRTASGKVLKSRLRGSSGPA
ncbi:acyl-CoA synthetase [Paractinoplanes rishiriensis]|uniref:Fatty-acyl-CoA synthase n=1 Tax=Paractinoplanes rishiriensis TaxID=1050105 RepID=A0A919MXG0_9ACTN|nr:long-chain fatty acid--CoA ligase [Actinoplanes rishiriensis]GIE95675.1 fatty-acyl-CoA synthase [Actinoplanes rishiriensis]